MSFVIDLTDSPVKSLVTNTSSKLTENNTELVWNIGRKRKQNEFMATLEQSFEPNLIQTEAKIPVKFPGVYSKELEEIFRNNYEIVKAKQESVSFLTYIHGKKSFQEVWMVLDAMEKFDFVVLFVHDANNRYDKNACRIYVLSNGLDCIGYLPSALAKIVCPILPLSYDSNYFASNSVLMGKISKNVQFCTNIPLEVVFHCLDVSVANVSLSSLINKTDLSIFESKQCFKLLNSEANTKFPIVATIFYNESGSLSVDRQVSYYLSSLKIVLERYSNLFSQIELETISKFQSLEHSDLIVIFRFQQRSCSWIEHEAEVKLHSDRNLSIKNLLEIGLLQTFSHSVKHASTDVEMLDLFESMFSSLQLPVLKQYANKIGISKKAQTLKKDNFIAAIMSYLKNQKSIVGQPVYSSNSFLSTFISFSNLWFRVDPLWLDLSKKINFLYAYSFTPSNYVVEEQGKIFFFPYEISFCTSFFRDRYHLDEYCLAINFSNQISAFNVETELNVLESMCTVCLKKMGYSVDWSTGIKDIDFISKEFAVVYSNADLTNLYSSLVECAQFAEPVILDLIRFSPCYIYLECAYQIMKLLEKKKEFTKAVLVSSLLLFGSNLNSITTAFDDNDCQIIDHDVCTFVSFFNNNIFSDVNTVLSYHHRRGKLWYRMVLDLKSHLKCPKLAYYCCLRALNDSTVKSGYRVSLLDRCKKIYDSLYGDVHHVVFPYPIIGSLLELIPIHTIFARPTNNTAGVKSKFFGFEDKICSVEELVIGHFSLEGYKGFHTEGSLWSVLFGLFFIKIIFQSLPDAFHYHSQDSPLDFRHEGFYWKRKESIHIVLEKIKQGAFSDLFNEAFRHKGARVVGLQWDLYTQEELLEICISLGGNFLAAILQVMVRDRCWTGGLPDLLLIRDNKGILVEVKGPRDILSDQQKAWLLVLHHLNVPVMICKVSDKKIVLNCSESILSGEEFDIL